MTDIVERLRDLTAGYALEYSWRAVLGEAADEIERLRKRVEFVPSYKVRCDALEEAADVVIYALDNAQGSAIADVIRACKEKP